MSFSLTEGIEIYLRTTYDSLPTLSVMLESCPLVFTGTLLLNGACVTQF